MLMVSCAFLVILAKNPMVSVFFLIITFFFSVFFFLLFGAEFIAVAVLVIYVGAISILFLFVVMLLNLRLVELYSTFYNYFPIGLIISIYFVTSLTFFFFYDLSFTKSNIFFGATPLQSISDLQYPNNTSYLGWVLYSYNGHMVVLVALILLVAMQGSIVLTVGFEYRFTAPALYIPLLNNSGSNFMSLKFYV